MSIIQSSTEDLDLNYLNYCTPHTLHRTSISKVWRSPQFVSNCAPPQVSLKSELYSLGIFPLDHRQIQPFASIHRSASHSKLLQLFGIWVEVITSRTQHSAIMFSLSAEFSPSPHSSQPSPRVPQSPARYLFPPLCKVSSGFRNLGTNIQVLEVQFLSHVG